MFHSRSVLAAVALILVFVASSSAQAQQGQKVGILTCALSPSIGLIIGSQQRMACRFQPSSGGPSEAYSGVLGRIGLDIGITAGGALAWGVFAPTSAPISHGALAGSYGARAAISE